MVFRIIKWKTQQSDD